MTRPSVPSSRSDSSKEECKHCDRTIFLPPTFADNPGATHWEECWRAHHACAVATIERDRAALIEALEIGIYDGRLQTFEDRERFRKEARETLAAVKERK